MRSAAGALASVLIGAVLAFNSTPALSDAFVPAAAPYGEPGRLHPVVTSDNKAQAQPSPRRKPSPPVPGQSARGPAFKEECVWVGKRIVSLLARDDAMAAGDFAPFYRQFECPEDHLAQAFGCVVTTTDPSENEALADRIDQCWDDPEADVTSRTPTTESGSNGSSGTDGAQPPREGNETNPNGT